MIEIAIDGTAASGKGTLAKKLAKKYGFVHLDTGLLYRKVANDLIIKKKDISTNLAYYSFEIARNLNFLDLNKEDLRSEETAKMASLIATFPKLREILNSKQKEFVDNNKTKFPGCVLDGRDIGTKILPNADFKFFFTARPEVRAQRRWEEMKANGYFLSYEEVLKSLMNRDKVDTERKFSPLKKANDAIEIDTSDLSLEEAFTILITKINYK